MNTINRYLYIAKKVGHVYVVNMDNAAFAS